MTNTQEWLRSLKVGDEVYVATSGYGYYSRSPYISKVKRVNKKSLSLTDKNRFDLVHGRAAGSSPWYSIYIYPVTDKRREEIEFYELKNSVNKYIQILADTRQLFSKERLKILAEDLKPWAIEALELAETKEK